MKQLILKFDEQGKCINDLAIETGSKSSRLLIDGIDVTDLFFVEYASKPGIRGKSLMFYLDNSKARQIKSDEMIHINIDTLQIKIDNLKQELSRNKDDISE